MGLPSRPQLVQRPVKTNFSPDRELTVEPAAIVRPSHEQATIMRTVPGVLYIRFIHTACRLRGQDMAMPFMRENSFRRSLCCVVVPSGIYFPTIAVPSSFPHTHPCSLPPHSVIIQPCVPPQSHSPLPANFPTHAAAAACGAGAGGVGRDAGTPRWSTTCTISLLRLRFS